MSKRALWNMTICGACIAYIFMELWLNIQSPIFAALFVTVAGYELIESHVARRRRIRLAAQAAATPGAFQDHGRLANSVSAESSARSQSCRSWQRIQNRAQGTAASRLALIGSSQPRQRP